MSADSAAVSAAALLDTAKASPAAVAVHDKRAWLALFASPAEVNDPVGSRVHGNAQAIERFYETFIAPNAIEFEALHDVVCGDTVVRDVIIHTRMPTGLAVSVPTHIRYRMVDGGDGPRIAGLYAHWELGLMVAQTLRQGWLGLRTYAALGTRMVRMQGLTGVLGFSRGFLGVGRRGKRRAEIFLQALAARDEAGARQFLAPAARLQAPDGSPIDLAHLMDGADAMTWRKVMASGRWVSATVVRDGATGVAFMHFDRSRRMDRVRLFWPASHARLAAT